MTVYGLTGAYDRIAVGAAATDVSGSGANSVGIETTRVVAADATDTVLIDPGVPAQPVSWWDPVSDD